jgi:hypothetical protein
LVVEPSISVGCSNTSVSVPCFFATQRNERITETRIMPKSSEPEQKVMLSSDVKKGAMARMALAPMGHELRPLTSAMCVVHTGICGYHST